MTNKRNWNDKLISDDQREQTSIIPSPKNYEIGTVLYILKYTQSVIEEKGKMIFQKRYKFIHVDNSFQSSE